MVLLANSNTSDNDPVARLLLVVSRDTFRTMESDINNNSNVAKWSAKCNPPEKKRTNSWR